MKSITHTLARMSGAAALAGVLTISLAGCAGSTATASTTQEVTARASADADNAATATGSEDATGWTAGTAAAILDTSDLFTERDLAQTADTQDATRITLVSGEDVSITSEGVYVISGTAEDVTIVVDCADDAKVQLVLDGASITNEDFPAIYVRNADKVFVTTAEGTTNTLTVTGSFVTDGDTNTDAVIFSKDDLVLNGLGTLEVSSSDNGITSKDDLKVTGGTYRITAAADALEANDAIVIADGTFAITSSKDGLHAEDSDDDTVGFVYIADGSFDITAASDAIQATTYLQIDGGTFTLSASEALESTYVQVNGGSFDISASDDGINASYKSRSIGTPTLEITGGELRIVMGSGDTDALDANGNLIVSGGTIDITGQFAFDFDGTASFTGGSITVNGEQVTEITNSMMMGGGMPGGPMGGGMPGGPMGDEMGDGGPMGNDADGNGPMGGGPGGGHGTGGMGGGQMGGLGGQSQQG